MFLLIRGSFLDLYCYCSLLFQPPSSYQSPETTFVASTRPQAFSKRFEYIENFTISIVARLTLKSRLDRA